MTTVLKTDVRKTVRLADQLVQAWQNHEDLYRGYIAGRLSSDLLHEGCHVLTDVEYTSYAQIPADARPYIGESAAIHTHNLLADAFRATEEDGLNWQQACLQLAKSLPEDYPQRAALERLSVLGEKSPTPLQLRGLRIEFHDDGKGSCDSYSTRPPTCWERVLDHTFYLLQDAKRGLITKPDKSHWQFDDMVDRVGCWLQTMLWKNDARQR